MIVYYMTYLLNDICTFTPLRKIDYTIKKNIFSASFFKIPSSQYKNFDIYVNGLEKVYKYFVNNMQDFTFRLFIEDSIHNDQNIMKKINNMPLIECILYKCPTFSVPGGCHYGIFGMFVRFFPLFDFKNNDAQTVIITDIDSINKRTIETYYELVQQNLFNNNYIVGYNRDIFLSLIISIYAPTYARHFLNSYLLSSTFIGIKRLDRNMLINYIKSVNDDPNMFKSVYYNMDKTFGLTKSNDFTIRYKNIKNKNFVYGVDEDFLNILKDKYDNMCIIKYNLILLFYSFSGYPIFKKVLSNDELPLALHVLDRLICKIKKKFNLHISINIINNFETFDKFIMTTSKKIISNITYYLYKLIIRNHSKKKYKIIFSNELIKILFSDKLFGVYYAELYVSSKNSKITYKSKKRKKFSISRIEKLKILLLKVSKSTNITKNIL